MTPRPHPHSPRDTNSQSNTDPTQASLAQQLFASNYVPNELVWSGGHRKLLSLSSRGPTRPRPWGTLDHPGSTSVGSRVRTQISIAKFSGLQIVPVLPARYSSEGTRQGKVYALDRGPASSKVRTAGDDINLQDLSKDKISILFSLSLSPPPVETDLQATRWRSDRPQESPHPRSHHRR